MDTAADDAFYLKVGDHVRFSKTVAESDVYLFAGITGDLAPVHTNQQYMSQSFYGQRIVHGVLVMGFMSTTSSMMVARVSDEEAGEVPVSLGYDRVRFVKAALIGDTVTVDYEITEVDRERRRTVAAVVARNQHDETLAVAQHILKWVRRS
ncbi:MAG TPA: MaoC/PaaZ C-terminal domain-containing protein [Castellaniella sp.]|nr:MaoC/PaaZ C-terminal domain-containing protein [Castellaniella sp.]